MSYLSECAANFHVNAIDNIEKHCPQDEKLNMKFKLGTCLNHIIHFDEKKDSEIPYDTLDLFARHIRIFNAQMNEFSEDKTRNCFVEFMSHTYIDHDLETQKRNRIMNSISGIGFVNPAQSTKIYTDAEMLRQEKSLKAHKIALKWLACETLDSQSARMLFYLNNCPGGEKIYQDIKIKSFTKCASIGLVGGAVLGAGVGVGVGALVANIPGAVVGGFVGYGSGALSGFSVGSVVSIPVTFDQTSKTNSYTEFFDGMKCRIIDVTFKKFMEEDEVLKDCIDGMFTNDIYLFPVKAPDDHIYEEKEIITWLDQQERKQDYGDDVHSSPHRTGPKKFTKKDLVFQEDLFIKIAMRIKLIVDSDIKNLIDGKIIQRNASKYLDERKWIYEKGIGKMRSNLRAQYRNNQISEIQKKNRDVEIDEYEYMLLGE